MQLWIIYSLLSAMFAGLVAIFGKIGLKDIDSTLATTVRSFVMALFLFFVSLTLGKFDLIGTIKNKVLFFIVLSGIAGALSWLFYFFALKTGVASGVAAIDRLSVVFVVIFAILFLGEKLSWQTAIGALLITIGAVIMVIKK
ncbi:MAG: EamA family transporter [Candidatus Staskawiczbacteria bacterium]|nr:EamA family transporter [Candidatus Staskawiczbacteria bacterium]MBI3337316.1 EamA family transporter [Candidatus Staskawiczbacteria bacterium]